MTTEQRLEVLEKKLDLAIRSIGLLTVSAKPTAEWLDDSVNKIENERQIGVLYSARKAMSEAQYETYGYRDNLGGGL